MARREVEAAVRAAATILLLALAASHAAAQPDPRPPIEVDVEAFPRDVRPLEDLVDANVTVTLDCAVVASAAPGAFAVDLAPRGVPPWATVVAAPARLHFDPATCLGETAAASARLLATVSAQAPAFETSIFFLEATAASVAGTFHGNETAEVTPAYFSIVDAAFATPILVARPGHFADCVARFENFGNAATKVFFEAQPMEPGWSVLLPSPVVLGSRQQGATDTVADVAFRIATPDRGGYTNEVGALTVRYTSSFALDADLVGEDGSLSCVVTAKGGTAPTPASGPLAALLAAGAALALLRRR